MNEEALQIAYSLAVEEGYTGDLAKFYTLLQTNDDALNLTYRVAQKEGYKNSLESFEVLLGLKKKKKIFQSYFLPNIKVQIYLRI